MEVNKIIHGDCQQVLTEVVDGSVDQLVTDPPYGYSFMGKDWDKTVPSVAIWRECLRVLKPGAFAFVMSSPRADVLAHMIVNLGDAGFRTDFTPIYWAYASGFPKAMNIGKAVDKRLGVERTKIIGERHRNVKPYDDAEGWNQNDTKGDYQFKAPASAEAKLLDGSYGGFQPKPAVEIIIVAMKPLSEKTFVDQALKNGKGVTWLDSCRIPFEQSGDVASNPALRQAKGLVRKQTNDNNSSSYQVRQEDSEFLVNQGGRFPANLLVSDDCLNDGKEWEGKQDFQHSANSIYGSKPEGQFYNGNAKGEWGSFSRYFSLDAWFEGRVKRLPLEVQRTFPFIIEPKASKEERNRNLGKLDNGTYLDESRHDKTAIGCNNPRNRSGKLRSGNIHPTVKPLQLMSYLITLGSRLDDLVLDPFCGSGTTLLAAKMLGRRFIGIELNPEYVKLAETRVHSHRTLSEFGIMQFNSEKVESK